jgi:subtilase family serine protease
MSEARPDRQGVWQAVSTLLRGNRPGHGAHPLGRGLAAAAALSLLLTACGGGTATPPSATTPPTSAPVTTPYPPVTTPPPTRAPAVQAPTTAVCIRTMGVACYSPAQLQNAYDVTPLLRKGLDGSGTTIAIVDSFGSPTIRADLHTFDQAFGLPDPELEIVSPAGDPPPFDAGNSEMTGWAGETTLDVEWAHAMAPGAKILLVTTPVAETEGVQGFPEIVKAENWVIDNGRAGVISQSFGATEPTFPDAGTLEGLRESMLNAQRSGVTVVSASGDQGSTDATKDGSCCYTHRVNSWPSSDPLVTSVGGTSMFLDGQGNRVRPDEVWNSGDSAGGGGVSSVFQRPAYQDGVQSVVGEWRGTPDISLLADPARGPLVWSSYDGRGRWEVIGGTSAATPMFAGVVAISDQIAGHGLGSINPTLYALAAQKSAAIVDVTKGNNGITFRGPGGNPVSVPGYEAGPGYDLASGLGTVDAAKLAPALAKAASNRAVVRQLPGRGL